MHHLVLLAELLALLITIFVVREFPLLGWLAVSGFILSAYDWSGYTQIAGFGGIAIYPADVIAIVLLVAIIATPHALGQLRPGEIWIWGTLLAVLALSLVRGISQYGLGVAANECRGMVQVIAFTLWAWGRMRLPGFNRSLYRWTVFTGIGLVAVMLLHMKQRGLGQVDQIITVHGQDVTSRPLIAGQALVLGLLGIALLVREKRSRDRLLGVVFLGMAILCQHRTVWLALIVAVIVLVLASPVARRRVLPFVFLGGLALLIAYSAGLLDHLVNKFSLAYHSRGTLDDRISAFKVLVDEQNKQGATVMMLGQPFGGGYARRDASGLVETFAPHNFYVLLYLRVGIIGAAMFALGMVRGLWVNITRHDLRGIGWAAALITYCLAYNPPFYVGVCLAVALTASRRPGSDDATEPGEPAYDAQAPATAAGRAPASTASRA